MKKQRFLPALFFTVALVVQPGVAQIRHDSLPSYSNGHGTTYIPVASLEIHPDKNTSIIFAAVDTIDPATVTVIFSAGEMLQDIEATLSNPYGRDIPLAKHDNSFFLGMMGTKNIVGLGEIPWEQFEALSRQPLMAFTTKRRIIRLVGADMENLALFHRYLHEGTDDDQPPPANVEHDVEATVLQKADPVYPELALRAGLEGNVFVKVWVDKTGSVKKVVVLRADAEIFVYPAVEAAKKWTFTPATNQGKPVSVWVSIPFGFRLKGR